jgi:glycosyltransferase involved in cell wall biosynthesis
VENTVNGISPKALRALAPAELQAALAAFCVQAREHDVVHIQHEFSFFSTTSNLLDSNRNFHKLLERLAGGGTRTVITLHTEPTFLAEPGVPQGHLARLRRKITPSGRRQARLERTQGWRLHEVLRAWPGLFKLIVHTHKTRKVFVNTGVPAEYLEVLPIGFDERAPLVHTLDKAQAKQAVGLPPDCVLLSLFGFVAKYKGHEVAVKALKALPENYILAVVGGPHPEGSFRTLDRILRAWRHRDPRRLIVTGFVGREQLDLYHAATDICLAPYLDDTQSSSAAITWGLTSGKPVIASKITAFRELYETLPCLALVTPGAPYELAWQVQRLAASPQLQQELATNGLKLARQCSWDQIARRTVGVYEATRSAAGAQRLKSLAAA